MACDANQTDSVVSEIAKRSGGKEKRRKRNSGRREAEEEEKGRINMNRYEVGEG